MKSALPTFLRRFLMSVAVLMFLVGGATFNHTVAGHDHAGHEHADTLDHHHADTDDGEFGSADVQTVHCGANLLALTCEFEPISPTSPGDVEIIEAGWVLLKSSAVEPPPPRHLS
ncbi:MAG: hypothetical protein ABJO75_29135 [Sedimentitalea sp.]|uniref:hypothetical protein n=1 Tax=Alphaproteobacteria TaxID=28211 RepID=UPI003296E825